jgi:hypothetical protein
MSFKWPNEIHYKRGGCFVADIVFVGGSTYQWVLSGQMRFTIREVDALLLISCSSVDALPPWCSSSLRMLCRCSLFLGMLCRHDRAIWWVFGHCFHALCLFALPWHHHRQCILFGRFSYSSGHILVALVVLDVPYDLRCLRMFLIVVAMDWSLFSIVLTLFRVSTTITPQVFIKDKYLN